MGCDRVGSRCEHNFKTAPLPRIAGRTSRAASERYGVLTHNEIVLFRHSKRGTALVRFDVGSHVPYYGYQMYRVSRIPHEKKRCSGACVLRVDELYRRIYAITLTNEVHERTITLNNTVGSILLCVYGKCSVTSIDSRREFSLESYPKNHDSCESTYTLKNFHFLYF